MQKIQKAQLEFRSPSTLCNKKLPTFLTVTRASMILFSSCLAKVLLRDWAIKSCFIFPPHLGVSALSGETQMMENASFQLNTMLTLRENIQNTLKLSPGLIQTSVHS